MGSCGLPPAIATKLQYRRPMRVSEIMVFPTPYGLADLSLAIFGPSGVASSLLVVAHIQ